MSKRRHNFGTKRFKKKNPIYISCPYRAEVADTAVCTPDCARCQNRENTQTHTHRHTDRTSAVTLAHARRGLKMYLQKAGEPENDEGFLKHIASFIPSKPRIVVTVFRLYIYGLSKWLLTQLTHAQCPYSKSMCELTRALDMYYTLINPRRAKLIT